MTPAAVVALVAVNDAAALAAAVIAVAAARRGLLTMRLAPRPRTTPPAPKEGQQ